MTQTDTLEKLPIPRLLTVVERREYWVQIGDKEYYYLLDGALYDEFRAAWNNPSKWLWVHFLKRNCLDWKEVI